MKKTFICSLICHNGIIGGALYLEDKAIIYRTNKLTVDQKYKNLVLMNDETVRLTWKWMVFPVAILHTANGEQYKFIIFNKRRFDKYYHEVKSLSTD